MRKRRITKNDFYKNEIIIDFYYCKLKDFTDVLQNNYVGYMSGVNGWNCDIYEINIEGLHIYLSEGYKPINKNKNKIMPEKEIRELIYKFLRQKQEEIKYKNEK